MPFGCPFPGVSPRPEAGSSWGDATPPPSARGWSFWTSPHASLVTPLHTRGVLVEDLSPHCSPLPGAERTRVLGCLTPLGGPGEANRGGEPSLGRCGGCSLCVHESRGDREAPRAPALWMLAACCSVRRLWGRSSLAKAGLSWVF